METERTKLVRRQLDAKLKRFRPLMNTKPPRKGWIRAIRDALGMTGEQLANRIGTNKQGVASIESNEAEGSVNFKTMKRVAEGLDCVFVYGFVPRTSLEATVIQRAIYVAKKRVGKVARTMELEQQKLGEREQKIALRVIMRKLIETSPKTLWSED